MTKYKQQFQDMVSTHLELFAKFKELHDAYVLDPVATKEKFNKEGQKILLIIQRFDSLLCAKSEGGKYGKFSEKLSDKFWQEVRKNFPKIDYVGMK